MNLEDLRNAIVASNANFAEASPTARIWPTPSARTISC